MKQLSFFEIDSEEKIMISRCHVCKVYFTEEHQHCPWGCKHGSSWVGWSNAYVPGLGGANYYKPYDWETNPKYDDHLNRTCCKECGEYGKWCYCNKEWCPSTKKFYCN